MRKTKYTVKCTTSFKKDYKWAIIRGMKIELLEQDMALHMLDRTGSHSTCLANKPSVAVWENLYSVFSVLLRVPLLDHGTYPVSGG